MVADALPGLERLSWRDICERFPDEWVVLVDSDWADARDFVHSTAKVFSHRKRRREASADIGAACGAFERVGCFFTGDVRVTEARLGRR
jgi:hypothetical protein